MSIFKSIGKVAKGALSILAPTIAGALPGPLGSIARAAVTEALGLDKDSSDEKIEQALATTNPEILERVRKAEQDFQVQMERIGVDLEKVFADDRASARARHVAVRDKLPGFLAVSTLVAWMANTAGLFFYVPPEANKDILLMLEGVLTVSLRDVYGYFFGSSSGSKAKTEILGSNSG